MRRVIIFIMVAFILLASSVTSFAMGFDAEVIYNSIFVIETESSIGSGFALGKNIIVTNSHVIDNSRMISVRTYDGKTFSADIITSDSKLDIAFLIVEDAEFIPLKIGNINDAKIGDDIYTVGAPNSMTYTLTKGVISAKDRSITGQKYIQIDAAINSGNSGGPLLDDSGYVLGMNTLKMSNSEGIGLSIPITRIIEYAKSVGITFDKAYVNDSTQPDKSQIETKESKVEGLDDTTAAFNDLPDYSFEDKNKGFILPIIIIVAVLVIAALAIIIIYKKNANKDIKVLDPSERTDFEIEIEERD